MSHDDHSIYTRDAKWLCKKAKSKKSKRGVVWSSKCIIIMGKSPSWIWSFFPQHSVPTLNQKPALPHVLPRELGAACGCVLLRWREGGRREKGETAVQWGTTTQGVYETRPGGCQVIQTHNFVLNFSFSFPFNCHPNILLNVMGFTNSSLVGRRHANFLLWQDWYCMFYGCFLFLSMVKNTSIIIFLRHRNTK